MDFGGILSSYGTQFSGSLLPAVTNILISISPIFLAIILFIIAWNLWVDYVRSKNFLNLKYTVLELRLPKDTFKSPLAMETVLHAIHNGADGSKFSQYWKGMTRPWYSLELVSIEGQVKFFIWTEDQRKINLMSALYAQFPGIEIFEREDYTKGTQFDPKIIRIWAAEFIKDEKKKDCYPIKTYVDYGLDKDPKEEFRVDPLTHLIEFLGSVKPNQQVWFQFVIQAHKKVHKPGTLMQEYDPWKEDAKEEVNKILNRTADKAPATKDEKGNVVLPSISKGEQMAVEAIERAQQKLPFDVGIRALYIAPVNSFDTPFGIGGINSVFKQFSSQTLNSISSNGEKWHGPLKDPWHDYKNMRRNKAGKLALLAYRRRSFFYTPFPSKTSVFNAEELATLYHFPGSVAATPTLERVPSKKSTAPGNLPT